MSQARQIDARVHLPDYINALYENLDALVQVLIDFDKHLFGAVIAAVILAFGFVYIHPFTDSNGRIHRYLILHV